MFRLFVLAALFFVLSCTSSTTEMKKDVGISVQLWSVRDACKKDFEGTLKDLSDMGMEGVEFAGYYHFSKNPEGLKEVLNKLNLKPAATHIKTQDLLPENIEKTIAFHKVLGCKYLIVSYDKKVFTTLESNAEMPVLMPESFTPVMNSISLCFDGFHGDYLTETDSQRTELKRIGKISYGKVFRLSFTNGIPAFS